MKADLVIKKTNLVDPVINFHAFSHDKEGELESDIDNTLKVNKYFQASVLKEKGHKIFAAGPSICQTSLFSDISKEANPDTAFNI